jgi:Putative polyhydroxyalkanoic acid system protein (PHA_gran_rgn)
MSKPLVLSISHTLGKEEAVRRLKSGLASVPADFRQVLNVQEAVWTDGHLQFRVSALGQVASGTIDVARDHVRLEVALPWLLAQLVEKIRPLIQKQGSLMLEKK